MADQSGHLVVKIHLSGVAEMRAAFRDLPKDANKALRERTQKLSDDLAQKVAAAARGSSKQSALVAPTVKARRDRVPTIVAGSKKRVGRNRVPAHKVMFGANFGASHLRQFRPHRMAGQDDYWFFDTIEQNEAEIDRQWNRVVDDVASEWGRGG